MNMFYKVLIISNILTTTYIGITLNEFNKCINYNMLRMIDEKAHTNKILDDINQALKNYYNFK